MGKKKSVVITALRNFGIDDRNDRGDMFVVFAEIINLKIMNILFDHKANKIWKLKNSIVKLTMMSTSVKKCDSIIFN